MNGRVYDYQLGRFLSVDPFIQAPLNSQSMNPYSYIMNNPLSGTDPTGYDADPSVGTNIPGVEAVGTETSATGSHLPSASAFGNELAGTGKKDNGTQTQGAVAPSKPSASPAIDSNASTFGSHPAFQESTASGSSGTIDASGCAEAGVPCHVQSASAPESNGAFGAPPSANEDVSIARQLLRFGAKVEEAIVDLFSGAAETKVAGEVGEAGASDAVLFNRAGREYPSVLNPGTGKPIPFPSGKLEKVAVSDRVPWGAQERGDFIKQWYKRGYSTPPGGWSEYDIHHVLPREYGGTNAFENLVPVERDTHQSEFNAWWRDR
jgi:hypothetical protein